MLVGDAYVDPTEWWDAKWVDEKVMSRLGAATTRGRRPHPRRRGASACARALLAWYRRERRDLPWRRTRDP